MINFVSNFKNTIKDFGNIIKIESLLNVTKIKVGTILTVGAIGLSTNIYALEDMVKDEPYQEEKNEKLEKNPIASILTEEDSTYIKIKKIGNKNYYIIPEKTYPFEVREFIKKYKFNYEAFINSVIRKESSGKPSALNKSTNAIGLTQFLPSTLISKGYNKGGKLTKKMIASFKINLELQFKYIHKYNAETFRIISQSPELIDRELKKGKDIATVLVEFGAEANFAGHRSIGKGWKGNDGITSISEYKKDVLIYFREIVAVNDDLNQDIDEINLKFSNEISNNVLNQNTILFTEVDAPIELKFSNEISTNVLNQNTAPYITEVEVSIDNEVSKINNPNLNSDITSL